MTRRFPVLATLLVLAAVGLMVGLGVWQIRRLHEKEAMLARYEAAQANPVPRTWPDAGSDILPLSYSHVVTQCVHVAQVAGQSGQNRAHQAGWAQVAECTLPRGFRARVVLGWANQPAAVVWRGGPVRGVYVAKGEQVPIIFADPPLAGLQAIARPDPRTIPNNHFSYAVQWFLFAATALVIYALALRKRLKGE